MIYEKEESGTETGVPFRFIVKDSLDQLFRRLHTGMVLRGRVVRRLTPTKCILRVYGYNMVAYSNLRLENRQEVLVLVQKLNPLPIFKIVGYPA